MSPESTNCARCGASIDPAECFTVLDESGLRTASLCRLEHIVAWVLRGANWQFDQPWEVPESQRHAVGPVVLERRRAGTRSATKFEDVDALRRWASSGGAWANAHEAS